MATSISARPETKAATGVGVPQALVAGLADALATDADLRRLAAVWGRLSTDDRKVIVRHAEALAATPL